jgi:nucleoside-diphosphate-sugar epimerase
LLVEDAKIEPRNLTGLAKLQTEMDLEFLSKVGQNKFTQASARIYRVYGKGSRDIVSRWVRAILRGQEISVFDPDNRFDYIYAGDVAEGLLRMCISDISGTYNLGFGKSRAIKEVVAILKKELGQIKVKETNDSIFKESSQADMDKMKKDMNWTPPTSLEKGINILGSV